MARNCIFVACLCLVSLARISYAENAQVTVKANGNCAPMYLSRSRNISFTEYNPKVSFKYAEIVIDPPNPVIPGCMKVIMKNITLLAALRDITAEFEMRISGTPDPAVPTIKCGRQYEDQNCGCGQDNSCLYCGFCKKMSRRNGKLAIDATRKTGALEGAPASTHGTCECDQQITPGSYDIETELCTPNAEEIAKSVPDEQKALIGDGKPVSLFTTVYLYDDFRLDRDIKNIDNGLVRDLLYHRRNERTIGCYLIGTDVFVQGNILPSWH